MQTASSRTFLSGSDEGLSVKASAKGPVVDESAWRAHISSQCLGEKERLQTVLASIWPWDSLNYKFHSKTSPSLLFLLTVEPLLALASASRKRPPLLSDQFSKIPKVSKSNHYIRNLLSAATSRKRPPPLSELNV